MHSPNEDRLGLRAQFIESLFPSSRPRSFSQPSSGNVAVRNGATVAAVSIANALLLTGTGSAQAPESAANQGDVPTQLPEVNVTGQADETDYKPDSVHLSKYTERILDTPQSITVVPQQVLKDQGVTTLRDALRNVSSVSLAAGEGGSQGDNLSIRGFTARNDIFLDGMRDFSSYYRDSFNYQEVEVLEGPSSITFGRGSTGGVVNQVSKIPTLDPFYAGTLQFGTDDTRRVTLDFNQPLKIAIPGSSLRLNLMANENSIAGRDKAESRRFGITPSLVSGLGTDTRLTINYLHQTENNVPDYGVPWLFSRAALVDRNNFYGFKDDFLKTDVDIGTIKLEHDFNENLSIQNLSRYSNGYRNARITEPQIASTVLPGTPLRDIQVVRNQLGVESLETSFQEQINLTAKFDTFWIKHALVGGIEYDHETSDPKRFAYSGVPGTSLLSPNEDQSFSGTTTVKSDSSGRLDTYAVYATDTLKFGKWVDVIGGVRYDHLESNVSQPIAPALFNHEVDNLVSWRAAIVFKPAPNGSIYFSAGTSFNPSIETLTLSASNVGLAPEKNTVYEIGTKWELFNSRLQLTGAIFQDEKTNARTEDPNNSLLNVLGGDQRVRGFSLGAIGHLTENWQVTASYTYLDGKIVSSNDVTQIGGPLQNVPYDSFSLWTTYELPWKIQIGAGTNMVSKRYGNSTLDANTGMFRAVSGYATVSLMAKYPITRNVMLQVNLDNLTNAYYMDQVHGAHVVPGAGRTLSATISYKF